MVCAAASGIVPTREDAVRQIVSVRLVRSAASDARRTLWNMANVFFDRRNFGALVEKRALRNMPAPLLYLGRLSFSLYLSHRTVLQLAGGPLGMLLALPVAIVLHCFVETPSARLSRRIPEFAFFVP